MFKTYMLPYINIIITFVVTASTSLLGVYYLNSKIIVLQSELLKTETELISVKSELLHSQELLTGLAISQRSIAKSLVTSSEVLPGVELQASVVSDNSDLIIGGLFVLCLLSLGYISLELLTNQTNTIVDRVDSAVAEELSKSLETLATKADLAALELLVTKIPTLTSDNYFKTINSLEHLATSTSPETLKVMSDIQAVFDMALK